MLPTSRALVRYERELWLLLGGLAVWGLLSTFAATYNIDEFSLLYNGLRLLHHQVMYRDFFEFIPPGSELLAAGLFAFTGPSVLAARVLQGGLLLLGNAALYGLGRALGMPARTAWWPGAVWGLALYRAAYPGYNHHWLSLAYTLCAVWALDRAFRASDVRWALGAGLAGAATCLTTQTDGLLLLLTLGVGWASAAYSGIARPGRLLAAGLCGLGAPLLLLVVYLAWAGALADAWRLVVIWPRSHYRTPGGFNDVSLAQGLLVQLAAMRAELGTPYALARLYYVAGLFALWPLATWMALRQLRRVWTGRVENAGAVAQRATLTMLASLTAGSAAVVWVGRGDLAHVAMYALPALVWVVLAAWRHGVERAPGAGRQLPALALAGLAVAGLVLSVEELASHPERWLVPASPDGRMASEPVLQFIRAHSAPGDRLVSLPWGGLHYFYGAPAATRFTQLLPPGLGYNDMSEYQTVLQDIQTNKPHLLIIQLNGGTDQIPLVYPGLPLADYRLAAHLKTPMFLSLLDAYCYERR